MYENAKDSGKYLVHVEYGYDGYAKVFDYWFDDVADAVAAEWDAALEQATCDGACSVHYWSEGF